MIFIRIVLILRNLSIHFQQFLEISFLRCVRNSGKSIVLNQILIHSNILLIMRAPSWNLNAFLNYLLLNKINRFSISIEKIVNSGAVHLQCWSKWINWILSLFNLESILVLHLILIFCSCIFTFTNVVQINLVFSDPLILLLLLLIFFLILI